MSLQIETPVWFDESDQQGLAVIADLAKAKTLRKWLELCLADKGKFKVKTCTLDPITADEVAIIQDSEVQNMALPIVDKLCTELNEPLVSDNQIDIFVNAAEADVRVEIFPLIQDLRADL